MPVRPAVVYRRPAHSAPRRIAEHMVLAAIACGFAAALPAAAYADDDLPARVGRVAEVGGEFYLSPQDRPAEWAQIGLNYPVTSGDNLWVSADGRAEVDYGGGQFRLAGDTNLHLSRLDDGEVALFVAQGRVIVRVRVLEPGEAARIDAPNTQVQLTRVGLYRVDVSPDRQATIVTVREGEARVALATGVQQVLPGQAVTVTGQDPVVADVRNGIGQDGFDAWSADRDRHYEQSGASAYVSPQMVGYADLDPYGDWQQYPDYGPVWFPTSVAPDWTPYGDGYWTTVGGWGLTWVDSAPWGYAPFHYGRWAWVGGRWGWCPGRYVARPFWAPALVAWRGGPGWGLSARFGAPAYGWLPLGWRDPYLPPWRGCSHRCWTHLNQPYGVDVRVRPRVPHSGYANGRVPGAVTVVSGATLAGAYPVAANRLRVPTQLAARAPALGTPPSLTPSPSRHSPLKPGAGVPPPASTFLPRDGSRIRGTDARPGVAAGPGVPAALGTPAARAGGTRARETPYPVLPPRTVDSGLRAAPQAPGAGNAPAGPTASGGGVAASGTGAASPAAPARVPALPAPTPGTGGRVVHAPPARGEARPARPQPAGIPLPPTMVPAPAYGAGGALPTARTPPAQRGSTVAPSPLRPRPPPANAVAAPPPASAPRQSVHVVPQTTAPGGHAAPAPGRHAAGRPAAGAQDARQGGTQGAPAAPSPPGGGLLSR